MVRGLEALQEVVDAALNEDSPPPATLVLKWPAAKQKEFNLAKDWIDQEVAARAKGAAAPPTDSDHAAPPGTDTVATGGQGA